MIWFALVLLFAAGYFSLHEWVPEHTSTTVGYGDIVPLGWSKVLASVQAVTAFLLFGITIGKIVSGKQEIAIDEIHRLTFEDVFRSIREGLFIARKDVDQAIAASESDTFGERQWEILAVAFLQMQMLSAQIPEFYDDNPYTMDSVRERLLQEAIHRTLSRIEQLLDILDEEGIAMKTRKEVADELRDLTLTIDGLAKVWKGATMKEIQAQTQGIRKRI